uniref:protein-serine/threonine phosphatase n=1 Tax=Zea mays TaxID=4577 RepID=A0A804LVG6_MAIZE
MNLERLRLSMAMNTPEDQMFNFDPKTIEWDDYFYRIHIPGIHNRCLDAVQSGCTALSMVKQGDLMVVANVGDSRVVLGTTSDDDVITSSSSSST